MATPPFSIAETTPADNAFISQFPTAERAFRDTVESWLLVDGNTQGRHDKLSLDFKAAPAGTASVTTLFADASGNLAYKVGTGPVTYVGVPPGTIQAYAGTSVPDGWLGCNGGAYSRTTYSVLFGVTGTTYGAGDGSTTFNVPDLNGRVMAGKDTMWGGGAARMGTITTDTGTLTGGTLGSAAGSSTHSQTIGEMAAHAHPGSSTAINDTHTHTYTHFDTSAGSSPYSGPASTNGSLQNATTSGTTGGSITATPTIASQGSGTAMSITQPTIMMNFIIKF